MEKSNTKKRHVLYPIVVKFLQKELNWWIAPHCAIPLGNLQENLNVEGFSLCGEHYGALYRQLNPLNHNCNKVLQDITKARKCLHPSLIQKFLSDNHDFVGTITDNDQVCNTCYKSHLVLIKHATNSVESTDSNLAVSISQLKRQLPDLLTLKTADELVSYTVFLISIHVGEVLLDQDAL